jgi:adenosylmethionine-8-amino-7-oxononanoate aminotransferase
VPFPAEERFGQRVARRALQRGLILRADPDWIAIAPPLTITTEEAHTLFDIFATSLQEELDTVHHRGTETQREHRDL